VGWRLLIGGPTNVLVRVCDSVTLLCDMMMMLILSQCANIDTPWHARHWTPEFSKICMNYIPNSNSCKLYGV